MATKTSTRLLAIAVIAAGVFFAPKLFAGLGSVISDITGANEPVIIGEGDTAIMVAAEARPKLAACETTEILQTKQCGGLKIIAMDAARMPFITRNMSLAWAEGKDSVLTRNKAKEAKNRRIACPPGKYPKSYPARGSCEEFPFASTDQGGENARTAHVPLRENRCQGGTLSRGYQDQKIDEGDPYLVVVVNPGSIADRDFWGEDIAKDQTCGI